MNKDDNWEQSPEYLKAFEEWMLDDEFDEMYKAFEQSHYFRNARLAYKRRINGRTKADH